MRCWTGATGQGGRCTCTAVRYDTRPVYEGLLALEDSFPIAANMANRLRPPGVGEIPEPRPDFIRWRWGDAPLWWDERDDLPEWRRLRGMDETSL